MAAPEEIESREERGGALTEKLNPKLMSAMRLARELLPGDSRYGDPLSEGAEVVEEPAVIAEPITGSGVSINPLAVGRLLAGALGDIRRIAHGMAVLPKLVESLDAIQGRVERLDEEVREMRAAVEGMGGNVTHLRAGIERLEPHLEDVSRAARPLRRIGERAWRREPSVEP